MRVTINGLRKQYKEALQNEAYEYIDMEISEAFWSLKKVRVAFERYIGKNGEKRINPNPYDTCCYKWMKPSEQSNVEGMFVDDVLSGRKDV